MKQEYISSLSNQNVAIFTELSRSYLSRSLILPPRPLTIPPLSLSASVRACAHCGHWPMKGVRSPEADMQELSCTVTQQNEGMAGHVTGGWTAVGGLRCSGGHR